jgi:acetate kinase
MEILVFNCGGSSLKFELLEFDPSARLRGRTIARGVYQDIGHPHANRLFIGADGRKIVDQWGARDHQTAALDALERLETTSAGELDVTAVVHRIVHGGEHVRAPTVVDEAVISALEQASKFAPLHNPPALATLRAVSEKLASTITVVVVDTAFHWTMPARACTYALPRDLAQKHGIRRFGFHGIGHAYMQERYAELRGVSKDQLNLITMQLGNGCSMTAIENGRSVDTSMGFTPLEGLVMGTRSGDIDPTIFTYLSRQENMTPEQVEHMLNHQSGLLGVSGVSDNVRDLLSLARTNPNGPAALALEVFVHRVRRYLGAFFAVLGRVDGIIFGGGIGEHAGEIRMKICAGLEALGIKLDPDANRSADGREVRINAADAQVDTYVIPLDEELYMARAAAELISAR